MNQQQEYYAMEAGMDHLKLDNGNTPYESDDDEPLSTARNSSKTTLPPADTVQTLYECYTNKVYFEGYVERKINDQWSQWYAELRGAMLAFWESKDHPPQCLSVADASSVEVVKMEEEQGNVFVINSANMQHVIRAQEDPVQWVCAIRLSCFELSKLQEFLTRQFLTRPIYAEQLKQTMTKMEGWVQVRFSNSTEWKKFWVTVSDRKDEKKSLFSKKTVSSRGQMMFSETKKAKPVMTMVNVVQASIVYPESANVLKVEGSTLTKSSGSPECWVYIMTENQKDLAQWCLGAFDAFKLYGRPSRLLNDPSNISALNFGEPPNGNMPRLFLELNEVPHINVKDETLLENKAQFAGVLYSKIKQNEIQKQPPPQQQQQSTGLIHQISNGNSMYSAPGNNSSTLLASQPSSHKTSIYSNQSTQPKNSTVPINKSSNKGRITYASDEDTDDEDEDDDKEDDSDESDSEHEPVLSNLNQKSKDSLLLPAMSAVDDGFASSILGGLATSANNSKTSLNIQQQQQQKLQQQQPSQQQQKEIIPTKADITKKPPIRTNKQQDSDQSSDEESDLSESEDENEEEEHDKKQVYTMDHKRPKPKITKTQVSLSGSDDDDDEASFSGSDDEDNIPIGHQSATHLNEQVYPRTMQQQHYPQWEQHGMPGDMYQDGMMQQQQVYYDEFGNPHLADEDGPIIPQLGDRFATQNSLLDTFRPDYPSARDQEGYARAMGQPLIQVPNKPPEPRTGLVGMISQIESDKKQKDTNKIKFNNSNNNMDREMLMERERERYMMEQRAQMMQNQPMISQGMMNQGMMGMMDPRMMMPMMGNQMPMMMSNQMPMMNMMQNPSMMQQNQNMMNMMMDPRMSMMMMQQQYGQYPMWQQGMQPSMQQQGMYVNFNLQQQGGVEEDDDDEDDLPLGTKDSPRQKLQ
ncbi:hypothetical protein K501DRAFT_334688 [Backusella circina FSU 941]|nr:hypothetical protein K501DRAFT_334688 [Backusella circina FSU 941]